MPQSQVRRAKASHRRARVTVDEGGDMALKMCQVANGQASNERGAASKMM